MFWQASIKRNIMAVLLYTKNMMMEMIQKHSG